jgi:hypothetical protein
MVGIAGARLVASATTFLRQINKLMFFSIMHATIAVRHNFLDPDGSW